jgi:subtilisin family serine protease
MKMRPLSAAVALLLAGIVASAQADDLRRPYIVQLADKPVASYEGDIAGLPATKPEPGQRLELSSNAVVQYSDYLAQKQSSVKAVVANAPITYDYSVVLNGFAAMLTDDEVRALQARTDVASVTPDTPRQVDTTYTSHFLGLDKTDGLWAQLGGRDHAGEGVVVGIVDTGVWPENPAYADRVDANGKPTFDNSGSLAYDAPPSTWKGNCVSGEGFTAANCNNKLIGAQYFDSTFKSLPQYTTHWSEFRSPRDSIGGSLGHGGHGTHTSSTAAGNAGVESVVSGVALGPVSGMAPRARIAMYKVCWTYNDATDPTGGKNSCFSGDSVAAIEKAVTDGVNVINFSIGGGSTVTDIVEQAFLHASNAGVFVSASAGNDGPANTVAHISPWQATVAASTHNRELQSDVLLGDGRKFTGASMISTPLPSAPMITSEQAALPGASANSATLCYSKSWVSADWLVAKPSLDPAKVAGKIVTCTRGTNDRLDKSKAVAEAGGVGMVEIDNGSGLIAEVHAVPTVHVNVADGALIKAYAAGQNPSAAMTKFVTGTSAVKAPVVASFSSRGPNQYDGNQLKPDLAAPGVDIIAGVTPELNAAQRANVVNGTAAPVSVWASYQGTSMAAPHVTGIAALLHQQHPTWSPAMIKSALMTSATDTFPDAITSGDTRGILPFGQGAGHINPNGAMDPGLVFDIAPADYQRYLCGLAVSGANCSGGQIAGYNLNLPSISVGNVLGSAVVTRKVTNVGTEAETYAASATVPGYSAVVSPASLNVAPGSTATFTVTLTRTNSAFNTWQFGSLKLTGSKHTVRIPVVARSGTPFIAPSLISVPKVTATKSYSIQTGFTGTVKALYGMKEITRADDVVAQAVSSTVNSTALVQTACRNAIAGVKVTSVTIPAGTLMAQWELFDRDTDAGTGQTDLDLAVLNPAGNLVGYSGNNGANEMVALNAPAAGTYKVCVVGYTTPNRISSAYKLSSAVVTTADKAGNFRVGVPAKVYAGSAATVSAGWSGLATGKRFVGAAQLQQDATGVVGATTVFQVETNNPIPLGEPVPRSVVTQDSGI